ncbi:Cysteine desulfurase [hydrothermal vent metagenome]|uniref:cysteine desulfurase n=1 Tax=hydrothermal vent metagenome TaxID=652676 RepID=A0A3B0XBW2_9ZZZZ
MTVYLDHNATTPLNPQVLEAMMPYMTILYGNPSSVHRFGRLMRDALEQARTQVSNLVGAQPKEIIFTSGGTEANNLALRGGLGNRPTSRFAISAIEHASVMAPAKHMEKQGWSLDIIPVNEQGVVTNELLYANISDATQLVSIMAANNETGVLQNVSRLFEHIKTVNLDMLIHSDACQIAGKMPLDFAALKLDLMSLSSHKIYGPLGAGALVVKSHVDLIPLIDGGGQEQKKRSGTENILAIIGFGAAAEIAANEMNQRKQHVTKLQSQLIEQLSDMQDVVVFSHDVPRLPNTVLFSILGIDGEMLLMQLDRKGFAVSSGSACNSENKQPSHILLAMSVEPNIAQGAIRVSFGEQNSPDNVNQLIDALQEIKQQFNVR